MSDPSRRIRQYAALGLLVLLYVGGIIGWSCAALQVDPPENAPTDTTTSVVLRSNQHAPTESSTALVQTGLAL